MYLFYLTLSYFVYLSVNSPKQLNGDIPDSSIWYFKPNGRSHRMVLLELKSDHRQKMPTYFEVFCQYLIYQIFGKWFIEIPQTLRFFGTIHLSSSNKLNSDKSMNLFTSRSNWFQHSNFPLVSIEPLSFVSCRNKKEQLYFIFLSSDSCSALLLLFSLFLFVQSGKIFL